MKSSIIAITGLSGSGKTTIAKKLSKIINLPFIITSTTRPIRPNEKNGVDYHFLNRKVYDELNKKGHIIANESFKVASGDIWSYGIRKEDLETYEEIIMVLSPQGVKDLRKLGYEVLSIHIDINEDIRLHRIGARKDNQSEAEIKRRSREDREKFAEHEPDYIVNNNDLMEFTVKEILNIIIDEKGYF